MSDAKTWCVVYNSFFDSIVVDEEGRSVDPASFTYAKRSFVRDNVKDELLMVVDPNSIGPDSNPAARMAAEEAARRNEAIDAEKAAAEKQTKTAAKPKSDR